MKRIIAVAILVCLAAILGAAQEGSKVQVFGGYQYTNADTAGLTDRQSFHGWNGDVNVRLSNHFSIVGDVSGTYKSLNAIDMGLSIPGARRTSGDVAEIAAPDSITPTAMQPKLRMYSFLTGPRFTVTKGKVSPFVQMAFGINHLSATASELGGLSIGKNGFGMTVGGGLDYNASKRFGLRLVKFDYMLHHIGLDSSLMNVNVSENLNHFRIATGVIYKF